MIFRFLICGIILFGFVLSGHGSPTGAYPRNIYGIHTWSAGASGIFSGKRGWTVESVNTANYGFDLQPAQAQQIVNEGFELILRINKQAGLTVPTNPAQFDQFTTDVLTKVNAFKDYCRIYIIGNEMNASFEGNVPVATYEEVYRRCRNAIHVVQPDAIVAVAALAPYNASQTGTGPYASNRQWLNYMYQLVNDLGSDADAYAIHAYGGRAGDSDPRDDNELGFGVFSKWMEILDGNGYTAPRPVYFTEFNHTADGQGPTPGYPLYAYPSGFIQKAFEFVNSYNTSHTRRVTCACWFAYANGGFPGYDITAYSIMQNDFKDATQNTSYEGIISAARDWNYWY